MLPRQHRLSDGRELNIAARSGTRFGCRNVVVSTSARPEPDAEARFGFIVSKKVGNAVARNLVKRRLREIAWSRIKAGERGVDVVVRALPASHAAEQAQLAKDVAKGIRRSGIQSGFAPKTSDATNMRGPA